jgi:hypothetical protein
MQTSRITIACASLDSEDADDAGEGSEDAVEEMTVASALSRWGNILVCIIHTFTKVR